MYPDTLIALTHDLLKECKRLEQTIGTVESCTGGFLLHLMTDIPDCSSMVQGAIVTYCDRLKIKLANVPEGTLAAHTAISHETAISMAENGRSLLGVDYCIATTGTAGPDIQKNDNNTGCIYIAIATPFGTYSQCQSLINVDRQGFKLEAAATAFEFAHSILQKHPHNLRIAS
jgi:nicotinamide-nucleotide amidase